MAWAFTDGWLEYEDNDARSCRIWLNALGGTNHINSVVFDYFGDAASVNDYILFAFGMKFWGIRLTVGTAFAAAAVTFVWEYWDGSAWATLPVSNEDAMTALGQQDVEFTPPADWGVHATIDGYGIRCRISALTAITEGGANGTNKAKFNFKRLEGTGAEAGLDSAEVADLAGTYTVLAATTSAAGLIPFEMPVNALETAEQVDVILAGTTAGAGDTVDLTGIDVLGNGLIESINVAGGNGTYTSSNAFRNITDVTCVGFADGTVRVDQKRWGIIDKKGSLCRMNSHFCAGDGVAATTITINNHYLDFYPGYVWLIKNATLQAGATSGAGDFEGSVDGCVIKVNLDDVYYFRTRNYLSDMTIILKGSKMIGTGSLFQDFSFSGNIDFQDTTIRVGRNGTNYFSSIISLAIKRVFINKLWLSLPNGGATLTGFVTPDRMTVFARVAQAGIYQECSFDSARIYYMQGAPGTAFTFLDSEGMSSANITLVFLNAGSDTYGYVTFTYDLKVIDSGGNGIVGATVTIDDVDGAEVYSGVTDGSGDISTTLIYQVAHNFFGVGSWATQTPHTATISKAGYATRTIIYDMDRTREEIEKLGGAAPHGLEYRRRRVPGPVSLLAEYE